MLKLLGVWPVAWLLPVQVSRFTFRSRGFHKPLLHLAYVFQNIKVLSGDPISTQLCLQSHFRRVHLCTFFCLKMYRLLGVLAVAWRLVNQVCSVYI